MFDQEGDWRLTRAEVNVMRFIATGCTQAEAAERLGISKWTAKRHVASTLEKLQCRETGEAVIVLFRDGVVPCPRPCPFRPALGGTA